MFISSKIKMDEGFDLGLDLTEEDIQEINATLSNIPGVELTEFEASCCRDMELMIENFQDLASLSLSLFLLC
jgi:hypothetical protein